MQQKVCRDMNCVLPHEDKFCSQMGFPQHGGASVSIKDFIGRRDPPKQLEGSDRAKLLTTEACASDALALGDRLQLRYGTGNATLVPSDGVQSDISAHVHINSTEKRATRRPRGVDVVSQ